MVRQASIDEPRRKILVIRDEAPEWAAHRFRLRPRGDSTSWFDCVWFYLGRDDIFGIPPGMEADRLRESGFDIWWEGRAEPGGRWQFVEIQHFPPATQRYR
jgi:hypothetical protein